MNPIHPMLATDSTESEYKDGKLHITSKYFGNKEFAAEVKYDGSRYILAFDQTGHPRFTSRNVSVKTGLPVDKTENLIGKLFWKTDKLKGTILDGEMLLKSELTDGKGNGSAEVNKVMLSKPERAKELLTKIEMVYVVYDILAWDGNDLQDSNFRVRRSWLEAAFKHIEKEKCMNLSMLHLSKLIPNTQEEFEKQLANGMEGLMLKNLFSKYEQGHHSTSWKKVKRLETFDGIVLGGQIGTGKYEETLGALIVGQYFGNELKEVCTIAGMTDSQREEMWKRINQNCVTKDGRKRWIFDDPLEVNWIVEFSAQEKTKSRYRHPRYLHDRQDKPAKDCKFPGHEAKGIPIPFETE